MKQALLDRIRTPENNSTEATDANTEEGEEGEKCDKVHDSDMESVGESESDGDPAWDSDEWGPVSEGPSGPSLTNVEAKQREKEQDMKAALQKMLLPAGQSVTAKGLYPTPASTRNPTGEEGRRRPGGGSWGRYRVA